MTISYVNKLRDVLAFDTHNVLRSPAALIKYVVLFGVFCWTISGPFTNFLFSIFLVASSRKTGTTAEPETTITRGLGVLAVATVIVVTGWLLLRLLLLLQNILRKNRPVLTRHTLTFTEDSLVEETVYDRSETEWPTIRKLVRNRNYLFLYGARNSAYLIPRRAIDDPLTWDTIYDFCKRKTGL